VAVIVPLEGERKGKAQKPSLEPLLSLVGEEMKAVNAAIVRRMDSPIGMIPELGGHIVAAGGKRLRPMLTLAAARLCGYTGERHIGLAACIELLHTATLLHDDVVDASGLRRGRATANALWGNKASVLVGDFLFSRAFQFMVEDGALPILTVLSRASARLAEGEVHQLMTAKNLGTGETQYLEVIRAKTAVLFAAAAEVGALVAGPAPGAAEACAGYGLNLGIAFQLVDDAIDYASSAATMGKDAGDDLRDGKVTLPVILAYLRGTAQERDFWKRAIEEGKQEAGDLERAVALLRRHRALEDTIERARHYGKIARDSLGIFPDSAVKRAMLEAVDFAIERAY
jgi:octaprenyl-diphosphate synthase